jgi:Protein of unknown function (DUF2637)
MRQLAQDHGQAGWHAHAFPLSVDGLEIVASLVLLADHRSGRRPGWLPWAALVIGTAGSLAANVATAGPGLISRIIAGWPALALLLAVKLLSGILNRRETPAAATAATRQRSRAGQPTRRPTLSGEQPPHVGELLSAARAARDGLHRDGLRMTRDALAARLRESGHPLRNSRLTPLLQALRNETTQPQRPRPAKPHEQNSVTGSWSSDLPQSPIGKSAELPCPSSDGRLTIEWITEIEQHSEPALDSERPS